MRRAHVLAPLFVAALVAALTAGCRTSPNAPLVRSDAAAVDAASQAPARAASRGPARAATPVVPGPKADGTWVAELGSLAPEFELEGTDGRVYRLSGARGKIVVLEWFDPTCPYVTYAYDDGPLAEMKARLAARGVAWFTINSTAPGRAGADSEANAEFLARRGVNGPCLLDPSGAVGRSYGARTAPHLFVINERGLLVYSGALDNAPMGRVDATASRTNYVEDAIADLRSGHAVTVRSTRPYGCAVKYGRP